MRGLRALIGHGAYRATMALLGGAWLMVQAVKGPVPRELLAQRLALSPPRFSQPPLWIHAASLGEVGVAAAVVTALRDRAPQIPILLTTFTETGLDRAQGLSGVVALRMPLDWGWTMRRFIRHVRPRALWLVETELWPNLLAATGHAGIPVGLINARLSMRALRRYRRLSPLFSPLVAGIGAVAARSDEDGERLIDLGVREEVVQVTGNVKFDLAPGEAIEAEGRGFREAWGGRPVWVAGSVRPDEEAAVLEAARRLNARLPGILLVWAPRHPQRFPAVFKMLRGAGLTVARRSHGEGVSGDTQVLLLDTLGELPRFYAAADLAFVGGSLSPRYGGHSPVEPAALGRPVLMGPHRAHFHEEAAALEGAGGLVTVADGAELAERVHAWLTDRAAREHAAVRARVVVEANRGAVGRTLDWLARRQPGVLIDFSAATD